MFLRPKFGAIALALGLFPAFADAQNSLTNLAGEYSINGPLVGDQVAVHAALHGNGGYLVWQDNATDGDGAGISARRLNSSLSGELSVFRVNEVGGGEQENPKVALLQGGGAAFVWQGGPVGLQEIYLRILASDGTFLTGDVLVNEHTSQQQSAPVIAQLSSGNIVVVWSSYGQDGHLQGVYGRVFSSAGQPLTSEFQINETTQLNQRNPQVVALHDDQFAVVWASERAATAILDSQLRYVVDIHARIFDVGGISVTGEILVSLPDTLNSQPAITRGVAGGFIVAWGQLNALDSAEGWNVLTRAFNANGQAASAAIVVNTHLAGDQFAPKLSANGDEVLMVWTSLGQDGSGEGVFGRWLSAATAPKGSEFRVNTTTLHKQIQPAVAGDGSSRFLVAWSGFIGGMTSYDLFGQRYVVGESQGTVLAPEAPFVSAISSTALSVTWPELSGYSVDFYEVYLDDEATPRVVEGLYTSIGDLAPGSTHSIKLLYQLEDGRRSPLSAPATGSTWGADANGDGLPDDWQISVWGNNPGAWPNPSLDSDGDGASDHAEFLAGTNPLDAASVLRTRLVRGSAGMQFTWTTHPGFVYQVQAGNSLNSWQNLGSPRFAHSSLDSINLTPGNGSVFYRVIRLR